MEFIKHLQVQQSPCCTYIRIVKMTRTRVVCVTLSWVCSLAAPVFPWFNLTIPWRDRVDALVSAMTVSEQISWLNDAAPAIPRLGLPSYSWEGEASHGVAWAGVSTVFPSPVAWGASFDAALVSEVGHVIAMEARAKWADGRGADGSSAEFFGLSFMVPNSNLFLDGRWGRGQVRQSLRDRDASSCTHTLRQTQLAHARAHPLLSHLRPTLTGDTWRRSHFDVYTDCCANQVTAG